MNVVMVALDLNPPWVEGVRNTTYALATGLLERGHRVHFLTKGYVGQQEDECLPSGIRIHRIMTDETTGYTMGFQNFLVGLPKAILKIAKKCEIDVIHAHSSYPAFGWGVGLISQLARVKRVFSLYSCSASPPTFEYPSMIRYSLRIAKSYRVLRFRGPERILVDSQAAFNTLIRAGFSRKKTGIVPIGIDTQRFKPGTTDKSKINDELAMSQDARLVLFAGDLTPCKGVELFLRSFSELAREDRRLIGLILSKGLYEGESRRRQLVRQLISQLKITENIRILGIRKDIDSIYKLSDVVVFPFLKEYTLMDTPRALLEAMACGAPVVATDVGAMAEVVRNGENGLIVQPNDESATSEAIGYLLSNEEKALEMGRRASVFIRNNHALDTMISRVERVYEDLR